MVFLMETKQADSYYDGIRREVGIEQAEYVILIGISGGLAVWWNRKVGVTILEKDRNFLD